MKQSRLTYFINLPRTGKKTPFGGGFSHTKNLFRSIKITISKTESEDTKKEMDGLVAMSKLIFGVVTNEPNGANKTNVDNFYAFQTTLPDTVYAL